MAKHSHLKQAFLIITIKKGKGKKKRSGKRGKKIWHFDGNGRQRAAPSLSPFRIYKEEGWQMGREKKEEKKNKRK